MITLRRAEDRGYAQHGWLESWHSFSFAGYHDPAHVHFRDLRVINEDIIAPGEGFGKHPHRDMEIITYVLSGELSHKDSMGNARTIGAGEVQAMSAGTGITHSEFNASPIEPTHLLQIWIIPHTQNVTPQYGDSKPTIGEGWVTIASELGKKGGASIHQDATMYLARGKEGDTQAVNIAQGRYGYLHIAQGEIQCGGHTLKSGDALMFSGNEVTNLTVKNPSEILLFDLA